MKNLVLLILALPLFLIGQNEFNCGTHSFVDKSIYRNSDCTQSSNDHNDYFRRYEYQKDLYSARNSMVIPIDIFIWQKNDGSGNYLDNQTNRDRLSQAITYLDESFYNNNIEATFQPLPNIENYDSTKIRFRLENIFFIRNY